jgi:hypothetical protein
VRCQSGHVVGAESAPRRGSVRACWIWAFTSSYTAYLLIGNQLAGSSTATETERVSLSSAEVTLTTEDGTVLKDYSVIGTGFIDAATASAGYGTMAVTVIAVRYGDVEMNIQAHFPATNSMFWNLAVGSLASSLGRRRLCR